MSDAFGEAILKSITEDAPDEHGDVVTAWVLIARTEFIERPEDGSVGFYHTRSRSEMPPHEIEGPLAYGTRMFTSQDGGGA